MTKTKTTKAAAPDPVAGTMAYWLITPFGALYPASVPAGIGGPDVLQVRARRAGYIDKFRELYCQDMQPTTATKHLDYQYRALCDRQAFASAVAEMTMGIDSQKMKPTAYGKLGLGGKLASEYHAVLNGLWSRMVDLGEGMGWAGSTLAQPDPNAPQSSRCYREGHIFPLSNGKVRVVACPDCGTRKNLLGGKLTHPKARKPVATR